MQNLMYISRQKYMHMYIMSFCVVVVARMIMLRKEQQERLNANLKVNSGTQKNLLAEVRLILIFMSGKLRTGDVSLGKKAIIHQVTTMLYTSKNVLFPAHNHLLTTDADDLSLYNYHPRSLRW